jgi:hypothetical protein
MVNYDQTRGKEPPMYSFKYAVRTETDNNWSNQISAILQEPLPPQATFEGKNSFGSWFKVTLPASVWALVVRSKENVTVGVFHSPHDADLELKEALNVSPKKSKVWN